MKFTYSSGARPLDGYTIKRGIGHGGFGEVYYALSDGGKETALKLVRNNLEVELRGMAQCLNLKHPNLVALYDIRTDGQGDHWVVMEYVSGESLSAVIERHPKGLPVDMAKGWFLGLAQAIGYLHDNGIVHRDLKPGNIFIENGFVKVGDYGLSKFITASQRSAQTRSVGTVHYMAPEVSRGSYGKPIDIYAAGIILYEMLTGKVPFSGESEGEILMKHLTANPDLSKLPPEYVPIVATALAKDPNHRYASFGDMARAIEQIGVKAATAPAPSPPKRSPFVEPPMVLPVQVSPHERVGSLCGSLAMSMLMSALAAVLWTMAEANAMFGKLVADPSELTATLLGTFCLLVVSTCAVMLPGQLWEGHRGDQWLRRAVMLALGLGVGAAAYWINGGVFGRLPVSFGDGIDPVAASVIDAYRQNKGFPTELFRQMSYFGAAFFLIRWWKTAERGRWQRFNILVLVLAGGLGAVLQIPIFGNEERWANVAILVLTAAIVQMASPWDEPPPKAVRRMKLRYG